MSASPVVLPGPEPRRRRYSADIALYGVYEVSKLLTQPIRLETTLAKVLNLLSSFLDMRHGLIALLGDEGEPDVAVGSGWSEETAKRYFDNLPEKAIGQIVVTQMPLVIQNVKDDPLFTEDDLHLESSADHPVAFIGVPIKDRGHVIGTLTIDRDLRASAAATFSFDDDVRFLTMIGNLIGQTVRLHRFVARDRARMFEEQRRLERALAARGHSEPGDEEAERPAGIVGDSPKIRAVLSKVKLVARSNSTVLLRGESGTGKELFARAVHEYSRRRERPFVALNCAALPESVLESELFGHEKGSFTGAQTQRKGRFECADGGTLFLDEIGEISPQFQAKLLRVVQLGEFERVGGNTTHKVDVRLVSATNRNLEAAVAAGKFRADLYYRLSVVPILLPPLRERPTDIPLLAQAFLERFNQENDMQLRLSDRALDVLRTCTFPGNVRELENCVCRTATLSPGPTITAEDFACNHDECLSASLVPQPPNLLPISHLKSHLSSRRAEAPPPTSARAPTSLTEPELDDFSRPLEPRDPVDDLDDESEDFRPTDRQRLIAVLESVGWVQAKAARVLGLTPRQVGYAIRKHDIAIKKF